MRVTSSATAVPNEMKIRRQTGRAGRTGRKAILRNERGEIFLKRLLSGFNLFNYRCIHCIINCRSLRRDFIHIYISLTYILIYLYTYIFKNAGSFLSAPPTVIISYRVHLLAVLRNCYHFNALECRGRN